MAKVVKLIYQDCPACGARKEWGLKQEYLAGAHNIIIEPTPFWAVQDKDLLMRAIQNGIKGYPFFTDGDKFAMGIDSFIETPEIDQEEAEAPKKTVKRRKGLKNGAKTKTS